MRNVLILVFLCYSLSLTGTTYYISPSGSDSNNGSSSSPWKTLAYACSKATASGDIIHVNSGTFIESNECILAVGVSIEGAGITSIIKSHFKSSRGAGISHASINLTSPSEGTNGNQHISNIKLDGDGLTGSIGMLVNRRSNVQIFNCTIVDFYINGITIEGFSNYHTPGTRATGNKIYNCIMSNCGEGVVGSWDNGALIQMGGQTGMEIYNNTLSNISRPEGHNSKIVNGDWYNQGCKYYNNKSYKPDYDGASWNFHIEHWNCDGGFEAYGNEFHGGDAALDVGGDWNRKGSYDYSWYIHDNLFTGQPVATVNGKQCICIEGPDVNDVWIFRNHMLNLPQFVGITNGWTSNGSARRIYIGSNILENSGWDKNGEYGEILSFRCSGGDAITDLFVYNNVIQSSTDDHNTAIHIYGGGTVSNVNIKNNIIVNNDNNGFLRIDNSGSWNGFYVNNNILYNNSLTAPLITASTPSNYTFLNNSLSNPSFVSSTDFHLQSGSPAIGKGVSVAGVTIDYAGKTVNNPPSIGAYESGSLVTPAAIPIYQGSAVANATPALLEITYDLSLANIAPASSSFTVLINSATRSVTSVAISGTKVQLTLANRIVAGDVVTVTYTKPATNPIQTASNATAASISNQQVHNYCTNSAPTAVITFPMTNTSFSTSANITVAASATDTDGSVSLVEFYCGSTKLGSSSSSPYTFTWNNVTAGNYSLTVTATDNLNAKTTSSSISISVANTAPKQNQHPIVKILNPSKGVKFEKLSAVSIDAIASDPDGSIRKVEFYNGSVKLVELSSAPYTYTWKDVIAGKYSIIAIATDNVNDTTVSSPVEFEVGSKVKYDVNSEIVKLYPNPNNGHFSVEFLNPLQNDKSEIIITDLTGKQVYNSRVLKEEALKQIDVSGSRSGIYVMMIKEKEILVTKKFIKN